MLPGAHLGDAHVLCRVGLLDRANHLSIVDRGNLRIIGGAVAQPPMFARQHHRIVRFHKDRPAQPHSRRLGRNRCTRVCGRNRTSGTRRRRHSDKGPSRSDHLIRKLTPTANSSQAQHWNVAPVFFAPEATASLPQRNLQRRAIHACGICLPEQRYAQRLRRLLPLQLLARPQHLNVRDPARLRLARRAQRGNLRLSLRPPQKNGIDRRVGLVARKPDVLRAQLLMLFPLNEPASTWLGPSPDTFHGRVS